MTSIFLKRFALAFFYGAAIFVALNLLLESSVLTISQWITRAIIVSTPLVQFVILANLTKKEKAIVGGTGLLC